MPTQEVRIPFPIKGVDRRSAHQDQDVNSTPYAVNVFVDDSSESRTRGGSRTGFVKLLPNQLDGTPTFIESLSVKETLGDSYQSLVIGTTAGLYYTRLESTTAGSGRVSYDYILKPTGGVLCDQDGNTLFDQDGNRLITGGRIIPGVTAGNAVAYKGQVLVAVAGEALAEGIGIMENGNLTSRSIDDWTDLDIDPVFHNVQITDHPSGRTLEIKSVHDKWIATDATDITGQITFKVVPGACIFDIATRSVTPLIPTAGFMPDNPSAVTIYRDRVVWAADRAWYMSRQGDPGDYNYSADDGDGGRAVAGANSDAGQPGDPIIALAPSGFDYLVMFGEDSTWVLRGDPAFGGQLSNLSRTVGCIDVNAWCFGEQGEIYFLSKSGLYVIDSSVSQPPADLSSGKLPQELRHIENGNYTISLAYDVAQKFVAIFATSNSDLPDRNWIFDLDTASYWQFEWSNTGHVPVEAVSFAGSPDQEKRIVSVCRDGYLRSMTGTDDDGEPITSKVVLGPFMADQSASLDSILQRITAVLDKDSGTVTAKVYAGDSVEDCTDKAVAAADPSHTITLIAGKSRTHYARVRGVAFCVSLESTSQYSFESMTATLAPSSWRRF